MAFIYEILARFDGILRSFVQVAEPYIRLGELIALLLAIVALVFAYQQYVDSRELMNQARGQQDALTSVISSASDHAEALKKISEHQDARFEDMLRKAELQTVRLEMLANALPTRFVGTFPGNLRDVTELVKRTRRRLVVLIDFCGYGYYSDPHAFREYYQGLRQLTVAQNKELKIICYNRRAGKDAVEFQFPRGAFAEEQRSAAFSHFYRQCFPRLSEPSAWEEFDRESWGYEEDYRQNLHLAGAAILETDSRLPFLAWIRDHDEAIVSFQNLTKFGDFSFRTSDPEFVKFFRTQIDEISAKPYVAVSAPRPPLLVEPHPSVSEASAPLT